MFRSSEDVFVIVKWRDLEGKVNARGEVAVVLGVIVRVLEDGRTGELKNGDDIYHVPLVEGFAFGFRDHLEAMKRAERYVEQYQDPSQPDPFEGQPIWG